MVYQSVCFLVGRTVPSGDIIQNFLFERKIKFYHFGLVVGDIGREIVRHGPNS